MRDVEYRAVSMSSFWVDNHTAKFMSENCIVKKRNCVVDIGKRASERYSLSLQRASDKAMTTCDVTGGMLSVWHAKLAHVDRNAIRKMAWSVAIHSQEMAEARNTNNCSPCVEGRMTRTLMLSRSTLESQPGAALHTDVS